MNRRTISIILIAVLFALLVGVVWFFFFRAADTAPSATGTFGTGASKTTGTTGATNNTNNIPSNTLPAGTTGASTGAGGQGYSGQTFSTVSVGGVDTVPGVEWLGGSGFVGGGVGGPTTSFVPKTINQLNDGTVGGTPGLIGSFGGADGNGGGSNGFGIAGLAGAAAGCALLGVFKAAGEAQAAGETAAGGVGGMVLVIDWRLNAKQAAPQYKDMGDCLMRTIAKAVLQQITSSIVNWINSGFNGKPSFVTNFNQFFTNVGDQAAGEFIRGTGLSFLCSPFQLKIRIALAQSYARRNAQSCTLTSVIKNVDKFMSGSFSQGGWGGMLQFTTIPTNNPFGAFAYAQAGLQTAQSNALGIKQQDYIIGKGFLSSQKEVCKGVDPVSGQKTGCTMVPVTPGSTIADALNKSLGAGQDQLGLAKSFDEIVNALLTQLMVKTLQRRLSSVSGNQGYASNYYTPEQQQAQRDAEAMLADMQGKVVIAQQYGSAQQGSISDIQNAQTKLNTLANCWETASSSTSHTEAQRATARVNADNALAALHSYDAQIDLFNANITHANAGIAKLQELQTLVLSVTSAADVAAVKAAYNSALSSGVIITAADVTTAQQDRSALQSALASRNQQTDSELTQCYAF